MRSSNEMYERGIADAEQDDLNLFYYQHYYHYRKGYDRARKKMRHAAALTEKEAPGGRMFLVWASVLIVGALIAAAVFWLPDSNLSALNPGLLPDPFSSAAQPTTTPTSIPTMRPTATMSPTAASTPVPIAEPTPVATLRAGAQAQVVNLGSATLRARREPGIAEPIVASFPNGTQVTILEGPVEADGYIWWRIEDASGDAGWSAAESRDGVLWLQPL